MDLNPARKEPTNDPILDEMDRILAQFTGGEDPNAPPPTHVSLDMLRPTLTTAAILVNQMGRVQVEIAAAAIAVRRNHSTAPVRQTLIHTDKALRALARGVVRAGKRLERLKDTPIAEAGNTPQQVVSALHNAKEALLTLRSWAFSTLAGAANVKGGK